MIRKMLLGAACAALIIGPANAHVFLQGRALNGVGINGFSLNGVIVQGAKFNGVRMIPVGVNVGGHGGVGLNGQVIAIEF